MATKATKSTPKPPADEVAEDEAREHSDNLELPVGDEGQAVDSPEGPALKPGEPEYDWAPLYTEGTKLKRYEDPSGTVVQLPPFPTPDAGDIFADLLEDIPDHVMLIKLFRQAMRDHAVDYGEGIAAITTAFRGGGKLSDIRGLLTFWSGATLPN
ncbi:MULTISPECIES: hypothetical protein [Mycobacteroides]|uniref:Tail assembly chaperone n=1 Tax=Mycobacteroides immunogenum TaxID=83262 RepID=A0A7V8LJE7_9MYCO|nr:MULTISPECIES: hypothetical protein [Mycobacteroides]AMT71981.1 hypothetical protein ABG82_18450 [Mycobacteroides immunogenum]ANO05112.1 hypothetical protein BAB75_18735 [Mycobacteroides immunogenum]KIU40215.1 hypothetical protein TL11_13230 [Mycobacteroides immunogenum]KPG02877.1 hypothetical protein AN909_26600 [Mycobacteroides immunogenum]KPG02964.1 hypothetical protein AN908_27050 [Mycobacteroides immunogenum]